MCCRDWGGWILPESRLDHSCEHDRFRSNQIVSDAVVGIFNGKTQVVIGSFLWEGLDSPIQRVNECGICQGHSSLDAPSELNPPQKIPSPLFIALLVPQAEG